MRARRATPLGALAGSTGWRLRIAADHMPTGTIEIVHLGSGGASHVAAEIELADDAQASIVESFVGEGWANRATGIRLARSARLMLMRRILGSAGGFTSLADTAAIGHGASLVRPRSPPVTATRIDANLTLAGEEAFGEAGGALSRGKISATTPRSSSATPSRTARAARSGARSPTNKAPRRSPPP